MASLQSTSVTGNLVATGILEASTLKKTGGTGSQFLKADGTVDSSAYITGITSGMVTTALGYTPVQPNGTGATGTWGINITGSAGSAATATSAGDSDTVDGFHAAAFPYRSGNTTGYYQVADWMQFNTTAGIYWPSYNGAHIYPNTSTSYGSIRIDGNRSGWRGIVFDGSVNLMMNDNETGHYKVGYGWQWRWYQGTLYNSRSTYGGGTEYTVLDSGNYNSWAPTLTGGGASGTWGINITGSAGSTPTLTTTYLGNGSMNVNYGSTYILRNENGLNGAVNYSPLLHAGAGDTMWQIQGTYGGSGNGTLYFRQGYNGSWGNWITMISSANIGSQSVSYASSAGNANTLDGLDSSDFMRYYGMINNTDQYVNFRVMRNSNSSSANDGMYIGFGNSNGGVTRIFGGGATTGELIKYSDYTYEPGSFRAPRFYDSNDSSFYLDPASGSNIRNLYVGDSGSSWSDPGGWGTQVIFSNLPHTKLVLEARTPGIQAGMYVHTPGSVFIGSYTAHDVNIMRGGNSRMVIADSYVYSSVYMEAAGSMRAPIFYDSENTGYYVDPNSTSYCNRIDTNQSYTYGWFRNHYSNTGLYNEVSTQHWSSNSNGYWDASSTTSVSAIRFYTGGHMSALRGYVYANNSNEIGFLNSGGNWSFRVDNSYNAQVYGNLTVGSSGASNIIMTDTDEGDRVIHCNSNRIGFLNSSGSWGAWCNDNGSFEATVAMYAPIFYDSQNTSYYLDPAGTSNLNGVKNSKNYQSESYIDVPGSYDGNYQWVRFNISRFNSGGQSVEIALSRAINDAGPYGGCTARFIINSREWHSGQENMWYFYTEHGSGNASQGPYGFYVYQAGPRDLAGGGYWFYMRLLSGVRYRMSVSADMNFNNDGVGGIEYSVSDPGGIQRITLGSGVIGSNGNYNRLSSQYGLFTSDARAPIFYDSEDTGYYGDFAGISNMYGLTLSGGSGPAALYRLDVNGGIYTNASAITMIAIHAAGNIYSTGQMQSSGMIMKGSAGGGQIYPNISNGGVSLYGGDALTNGAYFTVTGINYGSSPGAGSAEFVIRSEASSKFAMYSYNGSTWTGRYSLWGSSGNVTIGSATTDYGYRLYVLGDIYATGNVTAYSDARVKTNIRPIDNVLERVSKSRGVVYDRIDIESNNNIGFIAQELEENFPELVSTGNDGRKGVMYQNMVAVLLEAVKEQQKQIDKLKMLIDGSSN